MSSTRLLAIGLLGSLLWLAGCGPSAPPTLGDAYVAPAVLGLRSEFAQNAAPAVMLKHGDHLQIVDVRRKYVRVLSDHGQYGWVDSSQLWSPAEMEQFRKFTEQALRMPSQGAATVYDELNVHIEPSRQSPALTKIPQAGSVEVLTHKIVPKNAPLSSGNAISLITKPAPTRKARKERAAVAYSDRPPKPPAPKVPDNWQELSAERIEAAPVPQKAPAPLPPAPPPITSSAGSKPGSKSGSKNDKRSGHSSSGAGAAVGEEWSLVRTKDHLSGWVLTRNLTMSIPDEVAQYAEGKRIAAYFDLGAVKDEEKGINHNWLWAISSDVEGFDFESIRVFTWNRRRHRYETAYREHPIEGFLPIRVEASEGKYRFSVIVRADGGQFRLRRYQFDGVVVHLLSKDPYQPPSGLGAGDGKAEPLQVGEMQARATRPGWWQRRWNSIKQLFGR
jgi:hypothetical protein